MKRTLNDTQIDSLFAFCKKHHVHFYDIQLELVDHLANAIEDKMNNDPRLSFEQALTNVYEGFGVKGFAQVVEAKTSAMQKYCRKERWKIYKSYFKWPKIAMAICMLTVLLSAKAFLPFTERNHFFLVVGFALLLIQVMILYRATRILKKTHKELLLIDVGKIHAFGVFPFIYNFFLLRPKLISDLGYYIMSVATVLIVVLLLSYRDFIIKLDLLARKDYPEAFAE